MTLTNILDLNLSTEEMNLLTREVKVSYQRTNKLGKLHLSSPDKVAHVLWELNEVFDGHDRECFVALFLNRANNLIGWRMLGSGSDTGCMIDQKELYAIAIQTKASGVILSHNHPSGNMKPSQADLSLTRKVKEALQLFDVVLLDHIIISPEEPTATQNYFSFADEHLIN